MARSNEVWFNPEGHTRSIVIVTGRIIMIRYVDHKVYFIETRLHARYRKIMAFGAFFANIYLYRVELDRFTGFCGYYIRNLTAFRGAITVSNLEGKRSRRTEDTVRTMWCYYCCNGAAIAFSLRKCSIKEKAG